MRYRCALVAINGFKVSMEIVALSLSDICNVLWFAMVIETVA
jgi:hypothetical protein